MQVDHVPHIPVRLYHAGKSSMMITHSCYSRLRNDDITDPLRSLRRLNIYDFLFRGASRSRSKSNSPSYGKRNGGVGGGASSGARRVSRSRSPAEN